MRKTIRTILAVLGVSVVGLGAVLAIAAGTFAAAPANQSVQNLGRNPAQSPSKILPRSQDDPRAQSREHVRAQRLRELDILFKQLMSTRDETEGRALTNRIWMTWHRSGDRKVNDLISLATIYMDEGEYAAALPKLNEVIKRAPDYPEGWNRRATLLFHMGEFDRSLADIMQTLRLEPRHFGALAGRGLIYSARGQFGKALHAFEQALKFNPFLKERLNLIPILRKKLGQQKI